MKTIIKITLFLFIGYFLWPKDAVNKLTNPSEKGIVDKNENLTLILKGKVSGNLTIFNQTILTVKEVETEKIYHVLLLNKTSPKIDSLVTITIRKYDLLKINEKSITLYKETN